jgi:hypothetical protein
LKAVFVEIAEFTELVVDLLPNGLYSDVQQQLMKKPDSGLVIPGCGGLRKLRVNDPKRHKGKRGEFG